MHILVEKVAWERGYVVVYFIVDGALTKKAKGKVIDINYEQIYLSISLL